ncbi:hypothetical protein [Streptomyces sp. PsTaAH-124]|uniref:hypothetical protein n=1 Tax=Streptomyces sp. PsTaAH-124 TaxID=1157638 RepID=UPI00039E07F3|nr:hypothetical protein [Streptomyces sp. PsTaAH-124]
MSGSPYEPPELRLVPASRRGAVTRRGLRFGLAVGGVCALCWVTVMTAGVAVVAVRGSWRKASEALFLEAALVGGSLAVGVVLGLLLGTVLAFAPARLTSRTWPRGLLAAAVAGSLFLGEVVVSAEGGILPVLLATLGVPPAGLAAAACSGDIAGTSRRYAWLHPHPDPLPSRMAALRSLTWRARLRAVADLLWT